MHIYATIHWPQLRHADTMHVYFTIQHRVFISNSLHFKNQHMSNSFIKTFSSRILSGSAFAWWTKPTGSRRSLKLRNTIRVSESNRKLILGADLAGKVRAHFQLLAMQIVIIVNTSMLQCFNEKVLRTVLVSGARHLTGKYHEKILSFFSSPSCPASIKVAFCLGRLCPVTRFLLASPCLKFKLWNCMHFASPKKRIRSGDFISNPKYNIDYNYVYIAVSI